MAEDLANPNSMMSDGGTWFEPGTGTTKRNVVAAQTTASHEHQVAGPTIESVATTTSKGTAIVLEQNAPVDAQVKCKKPQDTDPATT